MQMVEESMVDNATVVGMQMVEESMVDNATVVGMQMAGKSIVEAEVSGETRHADGQRERHGRAD
jgi:hypothetical protein